MRKKISLLLAFVMIIQCTACGINNDKKKPDKASEGVLQNFYTKEAIENWYVTEEDNEIEINVADIKLNGEQVTSFPIVLLKDSELSFCVTPSEDGEYMIIPRYAVAGEEVGSDALFEISVQEKSKIAQLPILWYDSQRDATDRKGNEIVPKQACLEEGVCSPFLDYSNISRNIMMWSLTGGEKTEISILSQEQDVQIEGLVVCKKEISSEYIEHEADKVPTIIIEAEDYSVKSDSYIIPSAVCNASLYPYDTYYKKMNMIDSSAWDAAGQKILWEFNVEKEGYYRLGMRCKQNTDVNKTVFRKIEIDGKVPFKEWEAACISYTGASGYHNQTFKINDQDAVVHLTEGSHTIAMTVTLGEYEEVYAQIFELMNDVNTLGMELLKLTGGKTDQNRTWDMDAYMPDAVSRIEEYAERTDEIYEALSKIDSSDPVYAADLETASEKLRDLLEEPEEIPGKTEEICRGDDSASKYLGNVLGTLISQGLAVDRLYLYGNETLLSAKSNFLTSCMDGVKRFIRSFDSEATEGSISNKKNDEELQVWVGQSAIIVEILQQMVDETYNKEHDTNIKLVVMPNEQKLILANATGTNPDLVIAAPSGMAFTFAARGALENLLEFDEFREEYGSQYQIESLVTTSYADGVYGAIDSKNFQLLFYRKDILDMLNLEVPDTWSDVRAMMPVLLRNQMNFYIPLSTTNALKGLGVTSPFLFQHDADLYKENGAATDIDSENAIEGIEEMTEFYRIYAMQQSVENFYLSFRYGDIPIGIGDFNTYLQLKMAAPELAGQWGVALCPGNVDEEGNVVRYQSANATASLIFKNSDKKEEAWEFLKWWLDEETQYEFSSRRISVYGPEYQWNTANLQAFEKIPFDRSVKELVLEQWTHQKEVTPHPASYMLERELSGVWNDVVISNGSLVESLDRAVLLTNREIERKLVEFGYIDEEGNLIRDYNTRVLEMLYEEFDEKNR